MKSCVHQIDKVLSVWVFDLRRMLLLVRQFARIMWSSVYVHLDFHVHSHIASVLKLRFG